MPVLPEPTPTAPVERYTVAVNEVPVKELLFALARDAKVNVDIHPEIDGVVTINAVEQTLPQILKRIARQVDMRYEYDGDNLFVSKDTPFLRTYKVDYVNLSRESNSSSSISTQISSTSGGDAGAASSGGNDSTMDVTTESNNNFWSRLVSNISAILGESSNSASGGEVIGTDTVIPNPETGFISVRATALQHEQIQSFIDQVLVSAKRQVLIQTSIVEVSLSERYQAGIDWGVINAGGVQLLSSTLLGAPLVGATASSFIINTNDDEPGGRDEQLTATVSLLDEFGDTKILSSPQIMVLNNQTALLKVVENIVYFEVDAELTPSNVAGGAPVTAIDTTAKTVSVGIVMSVTPQIDSNGTITLNVRPTISRLNGSVTDPNPNANFIDADGNQVVNQVPQITVTSLSGGTDNIFEVGDDYQIGTEPTLYDASADFSIYARYSYLVQNQTLEAELGVGKIQAILIDKEGVDTLIAESYVGESSTPIEFRPGDSYQIYQPRQFVIESVASETQLTADNYTSGTNPDFDNGEFYRVMPAANSQFERVDAKFEAGGIAYLDDLNATFVDDGVELGDIVENDVGAFGEITFLTNTRIGATLYGPAQLDFWVGAQYTVYYDYVYSRKHTLHAKFQGTQATKTITEERARDVCLGYNADCTATSTAVNFTGNMGVPFISITDYQEDETTEVGSATFTPSALSSGNLLVSNIDFGLSETNGDFPSWFTNNDWHKLTYVAYSAADAPGAAVVCVAGAPCLTLNELDINDNIISTNNNNNALVIAAGMEIDTTLDNNCNTLLPISTTIAQNRANGDINEYFELGNCNMGDDSFQKQFTTNTFNDQVRVVEP